MVKAQPVDMLDRPMIQIPAEDLAGLRSLFGETLAAAYISSDPNCKVGMDPTGTSFDFSYDEAVLEFADGRRLRLFASDAGSVDLEG